MSKTTGVVNGGALVKVKASFFPAEVHVPAISEKNPPKFDSLKALLQTLTAEQRSAVKAQTRNVIKRCKSCNKANAFTLKSCNNCGTALPEETSTSENVLSCFVFGIAKSSFPYTISIRFQNPEYLVFDDLLANSSCHINAIPTSVHIPDWRYLLTNPQEGLRIVQDLVKYARKVVKEQFLAHQSWRNKYLKDAAIRPNEFLDLVMAGMNYPPSQFQLHLQFVTFPVVPFQYYMHTFGKVFMKGRFFPVEYIMRVLEKGQPMEIQEHTRIETIIDKFDKLGVSYEKMFQEVHDKVSVAQERLANWKEEEFNCRLSDGRMFKNGRNPGVKVDGDYKKVLQQDKLVLQNYGRPYGENRRPGGTYYKFARSTPMARLKPVTNL